MDEGTDDRRRPGPGDRLRAAREQRGLTVRDAAANLRLDAGVITALESDDFAALPAPIFVKGYLNAYGKLLGLPADELIADYIAAADDAPPPLVIRRGTGEDIDSPASRRVLQVGWLVVALVIAAGAAWWFQQMRADEPPAAAATPADDPAPVPIDLPTVAAPDTGAGDVDPGTDADTDADAPAEPARMPERGAVAEPPTTDAAQVTARLSFQEESWAEVVDARGERLYFDLARAGSVVEVAGEPPLSVFLGNSPGVEIEVDGEPFDQSRYNRSGNVARFQLGTAP